MVETVALKIANALKKIEPEKTASIEVMKFALEAIINAFITIFFIAIIGLVTGKPVATLIGFVGFAILRFFSGGLHLKSAVHCSIVSAILISVAPHIPLSTNLVLTIGIVTLIIIIIFAPSNIEGHARIPSQYFFVLKLISLFIVATNFYFMNSTICIVFAIQAITIIELKRR